MNSQVKLVGLAEVDAYWAQCEPLVARGLEPAEGETSTAHVRADIAAQRAHLLVAVDAQDTVHAAMVVQFLPYPNYKVAHIYSIGGRGVMTDAQNWAAVKHWMRQNSAVKVQGVCKPAQARLWQRLGFSDAYHMVRQDL